MERMGGPVSLFWRAGNLDPVFVWGILLFRCQQHGRANCAREAPGPSGPRNALHAITGPMARNVRDCGLLLDAMAGGAGWDFECPQPEASAEGSGGGRAL